MIIDVFIDIYIYKLLCLLQKLNNNDAKATTTTLKLTFNTPNYILYLETN